MYSELYKHFSYLTESKYIISSYIREYDISKANINILLYYNIIDKNRYDYFYNLPKIQREIQVGLLQQDRTIADTLKNGFLEFRRRFFEANNIQDIDIVSIKNDAIYLLNKIPDVTIFNNIEFKLKNTYTSYYNLNKKEFYYTYDRIHEVEILDIKGINKVLLKRHNEYLLEFLKVCFCSVETETIKDVIDIVITFYNKYINKELDIGYYRDFDIYSLYTFKKIFRFSDNIKASILSEKELKYLDINCNLTLIRELYQIYSNIYFLQQNRK